MTALDALNTARLAWERSQPQTFLELYPDDGLDEGHAPAGPDGQPVVNAAVPLVEPTSRPRAGGLTPGDAEPRRGTRAPGSDGPAAAAPSPLGGASASPTEYDRAGRNPAKDARPAQEVTV